MSQTDSLLIVFTDVAPCASTRPCGSFVRLWHCTQQCASKSRALRSEATSFDYKEHCLFCGQSAKYEGKKKGYDVIPVRTGDFQTRIHELCKRRHNKWAQEVESRLSNTIDLHAVDSVYHAMPPCRVFSANEPPSKKSCGRPQEETRTTAFRAVVDYIEEHDEEEQTTIMDLVSKMDEY